MHNSNYELNKEIMDNNNQLLLEIIKKINKLDQKINKISKDIEFLKSQQSDKVKDVRNGGKEFAVGDRVKITNKYKGQYGKEGIVTKVTTFRVYFILDENSKETFRARKNLALVVE